MITDTLLNFEKYTSLHKNFDLVLNFIKTRNLAELECGKHLIKDNDVFVNINEYETKQVQKLEAHKKYIDIQMVLTGKEYMGYTNIKNTNIVEEYNSDKDVMFLNGNIDKLLADNSVFFIFYPDDAHMPALNTDNTSQKVKKAIFKIAL